MFQKQDNEVPAKIKKLDAEALNTLPTIELKAKFLVSGFMNGIHKSPFSGSGSEFKEYLEYQRGDELRHIDWKLFARTDQLYIKKRIDERNMTCTMILDASASMNYPRGDTLCDKWSFACTVAAAVNLFLIRQKDAVSLCILDGWENSFTVPGTQVNSFFKNMERMNSTIPEATVMQFAETLFDVSANIKTSSIVMVISDFYCEVEALTPMLDKLKSENCEAIFLRVLSPRERELDFDMPQLLKDSESGVRLNVRADLVRAEYKKRLAAHTEALADAVRSRGGDFVSLYTDELPVEAISAYLAIRNSKRK